jgi:hypothetical protein
MRNGSRSVSTTIERHYEGYDEAIVTALPDSAVEAFARIGNPFSLGALQLGSGSSISGPAAVSTALSPPDKWDPRVTSLAST